jgi:hypothetical protein
MSTIRTLSLSMGAALLASITACSEAAVEEEQDEESTMSTSAGLEVARFRLGEARHARFIALADGVLFEEMGPEGAAPVISTTDDLSAVDVFLSLAPASTPVPRAIAALAEGPQLEALAGRDVVESLTAPVDIARTEAELGILSHSGSTGTYNCSSGKAGFEAFACQGSGTSNEYCDSGTWHNLARNSGSDRVKRSLGVFVACGTHVQITHQYRDCCSNWKNLHTTWIPGGHWMSSRYTGLASWRRRVQYDRVYQPAGSYLRAYSAFY